MADIIRVGLADDHPLWREGVAGILSADPEFEVVGQTGSASGAVQLAAELLPDLMLLDVSMDGGGVNAARQIAAKFPVIKIVMLTVSQDDDTVLAALKAGARGYVLKGVSGPELVAIVRGVNAGETYITPELATAILVESQCADAPDETARNPILDLSDREHQILSGLGEGLSNREIAEQIHLSEKTVKHYVTNVLQKLQVRNRVEAALLMQRSSGLDAKQ